MNSDNIRMKPQEIPSLQRGTCRVPQHRDRGWHPEAYFFWKSLFPFTFAACPFSRSSGFSRGVGGTSSSILARPALPRPGPSFTEFGNSLRRGVNAVTTLRADLRMVSRIFHSLFFAT